MSVPTTMIERRIFQILPHTDGGWAVRETDSPLPIIAFHSKDDAVGFAQNLAEINRPSKIVVYKRDKSVEREAEYRVD